MEANLKHGTGPGGWARWLLGRWRGTGPAARRLKVVDRVTLGQRQALCLVEADGRRVLVATSAEGAPAFFPIDRSRKSDSQRRVTW
jgi:flagellar biogenesis protein FliO